MATIRVFTLDHADLLSELVTNDMEDLLQEIKKHVTGNSPVVQLTITTEEMDEAVYDAMINEGGDS